MTASGDGWPNDEWDDGERSKLALVQKALQQPASLENSELHADADDINAAADIYAADDTLDADTDNTLEELARTATYVKSPRQPCIAAALSRIEAPCDDCRHYHECADGLACEAYRHWVHTGELLVDDYLPRKTTYRKLFPERGDRPPPDSESTPSRAETGPARAKTNAERQKDKRERAKFRREIAPMLIDSGRLVEDDEGNPMKIDCALDQLILDWRECFMRTKDDPVPNGTLGTSQHED